MSKLKLILFLAVAFFSLSEATFAYSGYIIYSNPADGNKIYRKSADGTDNGSAINSVSSAYPVYSPDGQYIAYSNLSDYGTLWRKNANDTGNGFRINDLDQVEYISYSPDGQYIMFKDNSDNGGVWIKSVTDITGQGTMLTSIVANAPSYSPLVSTGSTSTGSTSSTCSPSSLYAGTNTGSMVKIATQDNTGAWYITADFGKIQDIVVYGILIPIFVFWLFTKIVKFLFSIFS